MSVVSKGKVKENLPVTEKTRGAQWGHQAAAAAAAVDPLFDFNDRDHDVISIDFDKKSKS